MTEQRHLDNEPVEPATRMDTKTQKGTEIQTITSEQPNSQNQTIETRKDDSDSEEDNQPLHHNYNLRSKTYDHRFKDQDNQPRYNATTDQHQEIHDLDLHKIIQEQRTDECYGPLC